MAERQTASLARTPKPPGRRHQKRRRPPSEDPIQSECETESIKDRGKALKCPHAPCQEYYTPERTKDHLRRAHLKPFECPRPNCSSRDRSPGYPYRAHKSGVQRHLDTCRGEALPEGPEEPRLRPGFEVVVSKLEQKGLQYEEICKIYVAHVDHLEETDFSNNMIPVDRSSANAHWDMIGELVPAVIDRLKKSGESSKNDSPDAVLQVLHEALKEECLEFNRPEVEWKQWYRDGRSLPYASHTAPQQQARPGYTYSMSDPGQAGPSNLGLYVPQNVDHSATSSSLQTPRDTLSIVFSPYDASEFSQTFSSTELGDGIPAFRPPLEDASGIATTSFPAAQDDCYEKSGIGYWPDQSSPYFYPDSQGDFGP